MKLLAITPVFNEEKFLSDCIQSVIEQNRRPDRWIIVDDGSTDNSYQIATDFAEKHNWIKVVQHKKKAGHQVGSGIVNAFYVGLDFVNEDNYDVIMKLDADNIFPKHYFNEMALEFDDDPSLGICGGICVTLQDGEWKRETFSKKNDHVRGALKAWRYECWKDIKGIRKGVGWDTIDELLARFYDWDVKVRTDLEVKHMKPTGKKTSTEKRDLEAGKAYYRMGYTPFIAFLSAVKLAGLEIRRIYRIMQSYVSANISEEIQPWVNDEQAEFINQYRYSSMFRN